MDAGENFELQLQNTQIRNTISEYAIGILNTTANPTLTMSNMTILSNASIIVYGVFGNITDNGS